MASADPPRIKLVLEIADAEARVESEETGVSMPDNFAVRCRRTPGPVSTMCSSAAATPSRAGRARLSSRPREDNL
jgi:hypothetical protein